MNKQFNPQHSTPEHQKRWANAVTVANKMRKFLEAGGTIIHHDDWGMIALTKPDQIKINPKDDGRIIFSSDPLWNTKFVLFDSNPDSQDGGLYTPIHQFNAQFHNRKVWMFIKPDGFTNILE